MKVTHEELTALLAKLPDVKRRAILTAWRDEGERAAARYKAALDAEEARRPARAGDDDATGSAKERRGSKYGNRLVEVDGELFHSVGEFRRFRALQLEQRAGLISNLQRQVEFPIAAAGVVVCSWFADFVYIRDGREVVEDFKGFRTDVYKLKKKFVEAIYKIRIFETGTRQKEKAPRVKSKTYTATRRRRVPKQ
jgi:hypothetical protein